MHELGEVVSGSGEHWVTVDSHHSLAVYAPDVSLRLAYGLVEDQDPSFPGVEFPDKAIWRANADAFWQGALVARWTYLIVDGSRCSLPEIESVYDGIDEHPSDSSKWTFRGYRAKASEVAVARLLNDLVGRPEHGLFESYMSRAGITEVPDA